MTVIRTASAIAAVAGVTVVLGVWTIFGLWVGHQAWMSFQTDNTGGIVLSLVILFLWGVGTVAAASEIPDMVEDTDD